MSIDRVSEAVWRAEQTGTLGLDDLALRPLSGSGRQRQRTSPGWADVCLSRWGGAFLGVLHSALCVIPPENNTGHGTDRCPVQQAYKQA